MFVWAIVIFTVASGLCATSTSLIELCAWRVLQGIGGALMVPVGRLVLVLRGGDRQGLVRAIAILTLASGGGTDHRAVSRWRAGATLGVALDCRSNIPLGLIAVPIAIALVLDPHTPHQVRSVAGLGLGVDLVWVRWWG
ncbi:MAG: hypothetical protein R2742_08405 [Micropruina glycogenica]